MAGLEASPAILKSVVFVILPGIKVVPSYKATAVLLAPDITPNPVTVVATDLLG